MSMMRRLKFRLSLRTLMLIVALVAVAIEAEIVRQRWVFHRAKAAEYKNLEQLSICFQVRQKMNAEEERRKAQEKEKAAEDAGQRAVRKGAKADEWLDIQKLYLDMAAQHREMAAMYEQEAERDRHSSAKYGRLRQLHERAAASPWFSNGKLDDPRSD